MGRAGEHPGHVGGERRGEHGSQQELPERGAAVGLVVDDRPRRTASMSDSAVAAPGWIATCAVSVAKFTLASTPSSLFSVRSMRVAHAAQVMPPSSSSTTCVAAGAFMSISPLT
jgi:hypothetical protein